MSDDLNDPSNPKLSPVVLNAIGIELREMARQGTTLTMKELLGFIRSMTDTTEEKLRDVLRKRPTFDLIRP